MNRIKLKKLIYGSLTAAIVAILTALVKLPVPATGGYVHLGDGAIFLAAALMGPFAAIPAALGSALADVLGGYVIYALPTAVIKGLMGWVAGRMMKQGAVVRNILSFGLCELIMVAGYFVFECAMYGAGAAIGAVGPNLLQGAAGVIFGCVLSEAAGRMKKY